MFQDENCNSINPEVLIAYEQYLVEYCKYHKCELKFLPSRPGSFIVNFIISAATNIARGFFQEAGEDTYKISKSFFKAQTNFFQKSKEDITLKEIELKDKNNDESICKIEKKDFDKYIIKKNDSEGAENIKVHLDKALSVQYVKIKVDKTENINAIKKADKEENKYDNIKLLVSCEKKMTVKEIKEYIDHTSISNLIKKIEENIAKSKNDKKENNNKDYKNLFENTNN